MGKTTDRELLEHIHSHLHELEESLYKLGGKLFKDNPFTDPKSVVIHGVECTEAGISEKREEYITNSNKERGGVGENPKKLQSPNPSPLETLLHPQATLPLSETKDALEPPPGPGNGQVQPGAPKVRTKKKVVASEVDPRVEEVYAHWMIQWHKVYNSGVKPVLDKFRVSLVLKRLEEGYTVDQLNTATDGIWNSNWHRENKQIRFDLCFRDASHVDRFIGDEERRVKPPTHTTNKDTNEELTWVQKMQEKTRKMMEEMDKQDQTTTIKPVSLPHPPTPSLQARNEGQHSEGESKSFLPTNHLEFGGFSEDTEANPKALSEES